jgi:hypothetical protein
MRLYIKSCRIETSTPFQNNIENPILTLHNQYDWITGYAYANPLQQQDGTIRKQFT